MRPVNLLGLSEESPPLVRLAAVYAYGIARNPFSDGNKRAALVISETFLRLNGYQTDAPKEDKLRLFLKLADGSVSEDQLTSWFQDHLVPRKKGPAIAR
jgi:death-on-curing protein